MKQRIKMNKLLLVLAATLGLTACDGALPDVQNNDLVQPTHEYEIDTWGSNSEVYEFVTRTEPKQACVFVMLDSGIAMGLQCAPVN